MKTCRLSKWAKPAFSLLLTTCPLLCRASSADYLFVYFPSNEEEHICYALSSDGFHFTPLNGGRRVVDADTCSLTGGLRDPHVLRGEDGWFYMVATDMRSANGWDSNRGIVLFRSRDLVSWSHASVHFPDRYAGTPFAAVTRVWAPETVYDAEAGRYMIHFSLLTADGSIPYDRVYYAYADGQFTGLATVPRFLYDRGAATIDMSIVYSEADSLFHAFYKNEGDGGICQVTASRLTAAPGKPDGSQWSSPSAPLQQTDEAVEGAGVYRLAGDGGWVLMYDCYMSGHYQFCTSSDLRAFTFRQDTPTWGRFTPRHGAVIALTAEEAERLRKAFPD